MLLRIRNTGNNILKYMYVLVYMYICSFYVFFLEKKVAYTLYNFNEKGLGNCVDPDPNLEYGFGSIMSLTMDPI